MPRDQTVETYSHVYVFGTRQRAYHDLSKSAGSVYPAKIILSHQMNSVVNVGVLTDAPFECIADSFSGKLNAHPSTAVGPQLCCLLRYRVGADFRYDAEQVLI